MSGTVIETFARRRTRQWLIPGLGLPFVMVVGGVGLVSGDRLAASLGWDGRWLAFPMALIPFVVFFGAAKRFARASFRCPACERTLAYMEGSGGRYSRAGATCEHCSVRLT